MENTNKPEIRIVGLSKYVSQHTNETISRKWIQFGQNDGYFDYIINNYNGSVTNSAVINGMSDMIYGKGIKAKDASQKPNEWAQFVSMLCKDDLKKIITDYKLFGASAIQCIYNSKHDKVVKMYHVPTQNVRMAKPDEEDEVKGFYYSSHWEKPIGQYKPVYVPAFGTSDEDTEILYLQSYRPGTNYYSTPDYISGLPYAELEDEISTYHINDIKNGFAPTTLINFNNGQASSDEEKSAIEKSIQSKFTGTSANKIVLSFNDSTENETTVETIQLTDAPDRYTFLSNESMTKVLMSHRVTSPILFGINTNNGFASNSDEIKNASIFMNLTVINPFQEDIINGLDKVLSFNKISLDLYFETIQPWDTEEVEQPKN